MPGVFIDMTEHAIIDVDTGRALAIIDNATVRIDADYRDLAFTDRRERIFVSERVRITLELTALAPEFAEGFQRPRRLSAPEDPTKMIPQMVGSSMKLLTND